MTVSLSNCNIQWVILSLSGSEVGVLENKEDGIVLVHSREPKEGLVFIDSESRMTRIQPTVPFYGTL